MLNVDLKSLKKKHKKKINKIIYYSAKTNGRYFSNCASNGHLGFSKIR